MIDTLMKGVDSGSNLYARAMQPILEREKQRQLDEHFKKQEARLGANSGLTRQVLQQQLLGLQHKNDPMYEIKQFQALQNMLTGGGKGSVDAGSPVTPPPTQEMGQGMGMYSPEGMQEAQSPQVMHPPQGASGGQGNAINLDAMRNNPLLRGFFKHKFGIDPLAPAAETPDQKRAGAINQAVTIDEAKSNRKKLDTIEDTAKSLLPYLGKVNTIEDIIKRI